MAVLVGSGSGSGCFLFLFGSVTWAVTGTWLGPAVAVLSTGAVAWFSQHRLSQAAWDHSPQRRQDRNRPETSRSLATSHLVDVLALAAGAAALVLWAARTGQSQSVQAYIVGGGSGVALLVAGQGLGLARVMRGSTGGQWPPALVVVATGLTSVAAAMWFAKADSPDAVALLLGALTSVVVAGPPRAWSRRAQASVSAT